MTTIKPGRAGAILCLFLLILLTPLRRGLTSIRWISSARTVAGTLLPGERLVDGEPDPDTPGAFRVKEHHHAKHKDPAPE